MYFSGFSLSGEQELFSEYFIDSDFCVSGFSYGAIKAMEFVKSTNKRVDTLLLFSPAFFQTQTIRYKRLQLIYFSKNPDIYIENFISNIKGDKDIDLSRYISKDDIKALEELLYYKWNIDDFKSLRDRGIKIEIFLGSDDKIIDSQKALEFFTPLVDNIYFIKGVPHIL